MMATTAGGTVRTGVEYCQYKPYLKAVALMEMYSTNGGEAQGGAASGGNGGNGF